MYVNIGQQKGGGKVLRWSWLDCGIRRNGKHFPTRSNVPLLFAFHIQCGIINQEPNKKKQKNNSLFFVSNGSNRTSVAVAQHKQQLPLWVYISAIAGYGWSLCLTSPNSIVQHDTIFSIKLFSFLYRQEPNWPSLTRRRRRSNWLSHSTQPTSTQQQQQQRTCRQKLIPIAARVRLICSKVLETFRRAGNWSRQGQEL